MEAYCAMKLTPACPPMIGRFFDTMIVPSTDLECGYIDRSKSTSWKVLETERP